MSDIMKNPVYRNKEGYNGFDLSHSYKFTSSVGHLLPVYYDFLQPGDKVTCRTQLKTRTMPLETSAMCNINEHLEWFFVPMAQIYSIFGDWYYGIKDYKSSMFDSNYAIQLPYISGAVFSQLYNNLGDPWYDSLGVDTYFDDDDANLRLFDLLNCPLYYCLLPDQRPDQVAQVPSFNPFLFCAYQKIYYDYYRLSDREDNDVRAYNLDVQYDTPDILTNGFNGYSTLEQLFSEGIFAIRYRPWRRDFFTNTFVSPLFGNESPSASGVQGFLDGRSVSQWLLNGIGEQYTIGIDGQANTTVPSTVRPPGYTTAIPTPSNTENINARFSPVSIRTTFAVEKLLEVTRRAGKTYDKQTLAHFGVKTPVGLQGSVYFLGDQNSSIKIGDVISTADTQGGALGQIAGRGYGVGNSRSIKFEAPAHGILMCIYSAEPVVDYSSLGLDRLNTLINRYDFYTPEYDNLGMQPLFGYQCTPEDTTRNTIFGWQYRYSEYKTKWNQVHCGFSGNFLLNNWVAQRKLDSNTLSEYLINPNYLDSFMLVPFKTNVSDSNLGALYSQDPLLHEIYFDVQKASKMSTYGLPQL